MSVAKSYSRATVDSGEGSELGFGSDAEEEVTPNATRNVNGDADGVGESGGYRKASIFVVDTDGDKSKADTGEGQGDKSNKTLEVKRTSAGGGAVVKRRASF